jgi:hypothetical protein
VLALDGTNANKIKENERKKKVLGFTKQVNYSSALSALYKLVLLRMA